MIGMAFRTDRRSSSHPSQPHSQRPHNQIPTLEHEVSFFASLAATSVL
jgi:hypothetical protein